MMSNFCDLNERVLVFRSDRIFDRKRGVSVNFFRLETSKSTSFQSVLTTSVNNASWAYG